MGSFFNTNIFALPFVSAIPQDSTQPNQVQVTQDKKEGNQDHYMGGELSPLPGDIGGSKPRVNPFETPGIFAAEDGPYKDVKELLENLTDEKLFGEAFSKFEKERSTKYKKVNIALYAVRDVFQGGKLDLAKTKLEEWFNDYDLLTDKEVAHVARLALRDALKKAPQGDETFNKNVKTLLDTVTAIYEPKPKSEDKPKDKKPEEKKPEKKPEDKKPEEKKPDAPKEGEGSKGPAPLKIELAQFVLPNTAKGNRKDTFKTVLARVKPIILAAFAELQKTYPKAEIKGPMNFIIDNNTGNIVKVTFSNTEILGVDKKEPVLTMMETIAQKLNASVSFEKTGSDPAHEVEWPIDLKPAP